MRPITAVLFDLDDTLLDRRASVDRYLTTYAERVGLSNAAAEAYRTRFHELDCAGYTPRATMFDRLSTEFPECGSAAHLTDDWLTHAWNTCVYVDGATEILAWCRSAGLRTAIVTNGRSTMQRPKLERLGVIPLVDRVVVSGEEGVEKPDAELFRRAAERLGVPPSECVFVGDNPETDIAGAQAAGMQAIWFKRELEWPADSKRPTHSILHLGTLRQILATTRPRSE